MLETDIVMWHHKKFPHDGMVPVIKKLFEEMGELVEACIDGKNDKIAQGVEFGDVIICLTVLKSKLDIHASLDDMIKMAHEKNLQRDKKIRDTIQRLRAL